MTQSPGRSDSRPGPRAAGHCLIRSGGGKISRFVPARGSSRPRANWFLLPQGLRPAFFRGTLSQCWKRCATQNPSLSAACSALSQDSRAAFLPISPALLYLEVRWNIPAISAVQAWRTGLPSVRNATRRRFALAEWSPLRPPGRPGKSRHNSRPAHR